MTPKQRRNAFTLDERSFVTMKQLKEQGYTIGRVTFNNGATLTIPNAPDWKHISFDGNPLDALLLAKPLEQREWHLRRLAARLPPFRYVRGAQVWYARSPLDTRWVICKRRYVDSEARAWVEYYLEAVCDANVTTWAEEVDVWSVEEVPNS